MLLLFHIIITIYVCCFFSFVCLCPALLFYPLFLMFLFVLFFGTTEDHESASSMCELCLTVLLAARRRAHKSIAAQVCISKRTCSPTSAPETQNRPLFDFIKKIAGGHRRPDGTQKFATARGGDRQSKHTTPPEPLAQALFGEIS